MSFKRIMVLGIIIWLLILVVKYFFLDVTGISSTWQSWVYYLLVIFLAASVSRRLGVINILEAFFVGLVWLVVILLLDSFIAQRFMESGIFRTGHYWWSYLAILLSVFFLHKKRHVQIRKEQHAHHGHH
jgi:hypothetical protein